jgi:hypothetical protein
MTELETGAWISASEKSAQVRKEFKERTSGFSYQNVDVFVLQSPTENRRDLVHRMQFSVGFVRFEVLRNSVHGKRHL